MGTTGGGVFKSINAGQSWAPMTDKYFGGTIGAIEVAPSAPDVVYVGGGEYPIRGNVSHGDGLWKTTDGGKTWTFMGLGETRQISDIVVHPSNPDLVYVASLGHVWAPNPERGVFRSKDGGKTWEKILFRNDSTGVVDLVMDPTNPSVLYAGLWQAGRTPWLLSSGGGGSGMFKTIDGGDHWTEITRNPGLPTGIWGNIGITVSGANSNRLWANIEADSGGVFRSDDGGTTWSRINNDRNLRQRAWYYTKIHADPKDTNVVYVNNVSFMKSADGGKTFRPVRGMQHGDSHDLWIDPKSSNRMIEGDDGGGEVSVDGGRTWSDEDFATAQFYHVIATTHFPYHICGAQQDNSTLCGPSRGSLDISDWVEAGGGESGWIASAPGRSGRRLRRQLRQPAHAQRSSHRHRRERESVARQSDGPPGGGPEVPLPVDLPDHRLQAQSECRLRRLERRAQDDERRQELDGDLARSHLPRPEDARQLGRSDHARPDVGRVLRDGVRDRGVAGDGEDHMDRLR
jgi:photosystem II stability/assembly factor-like uncharacterized protein